MALKIPQPPPPFNSGLPNFPFVSGASLANIIGGLTLTCQTLFVISYEPGPAPSSAASLPRASFHNWASKHHTALENKPAATRYSRQVDTTRKY
jgi:hypothetical protein